MTDLEKQERDVALSAKFLALIEEAVSADGDDAFAAVMTIAELIVARQLLKLDPGRGYALTAASLIGRHVYEYVVSAESRAALMRTVQ